MKKFIKIASVIMALALVICTLAACGGKQNTVNKGQLIMATNASFPPYEYYESDKIVGVDAEIAAAIAEKLGLELVIEDMEFGSIIAAVQTGKVDMGMAGMTVNDERKQSVDFTSSYATGIQVVIVKADSAIASVDDLTDKMIGVQQDTTGDIYASDTVENGGFGSDHVTSFKNGNEAVSALVSGKVDAVIIDNEPAKAYVAANDGLKILETEYVSEDYAICVSKNNAELRDQINTALEELIADGTVKTILDKYISAK